LFFSLLFLWQAERVLWDYIPTEQNLCKWDAQSISFNEYLAAYFVGNITKLVQKDRFVAYTDATFTVRAYRDLHEGLLGPTLRMEV
jgi:hypothetical protein